MSKHSKKAEEIGAEMLGIVGMLMSDAENEADYLFLSGTLLHAVVKSYVAVGMTFEEIHEILAGAVPMYMEVLEQDVKKKSRKKK